MADTFLRLTLQTLVRKGACESACKASFFLLLLSCSTSWREIRILSPGCRHFSAPRLPDTFKIGCLQVCMQCKLFSQDFSCSTYLEGDQGSNPGCRHFAAPYHQNTRKKGCLQVCMQGKLFSLFFKEKYLFPESSSKEGLPPGCCMQQITILSLVIHKSSRAKPTGIAHTSISTKRER